MNRPIDHDERRLRIISELERKFGFFGEDRGAIKQAALALGVTTQRLRSYLVGTAKPSIDFLDRLYTAGFDVYYILYGDEQRHLENEFYDMIRQLRSDKILTVDDYEQLQKKAALGERLARNPAHGI